MNLFSRALAFFGVGGLSNPDKGPQVGSVGGISTDAGISVTDERAMQVSAVWACVQYITNSVCSLPLAFYKKTATGREQLENHYLNDLFNISPNALMKPRDFRKAMTMQLALWSNAYAEIFWNGNRPIAVVPLRPGRMTPHISGGELVYHYNTGEGMRIYSKRSILHLKGLGSDGIIGFERSSFSRKTLGLSVSADVYASKQFANGGRSGAGHLSFDDWLTTEQRDQARKLYEGMHETAYNKGRARILEGGVKWNEDGIDPDKMQMIETRKMQIGEIARFWGVPEVLIGGGGATSAWPASFEQQLLSFLTFTLQDYIDEWEHAIKESLIIGVDRRKIFADHDVTGFIKMDSKTRAEVQSIQVQNGVKTRNEVRKTNNDPRIEGGDGLTVQVNLSPIDKLGEKPPIPVDTSEKRLEFLETAFLTKSDYEPTINNFSINVEPGKPPEVQVKNDVHVQKQTFPIQKAPIVNVTNEVKTPQVNVEVTNDVKTPEVHVKNDVKTPEVTVNNQLPKEKDKEITFERDRNGDIIRARKH